MTNTLPRRRWWHRWAIIEQEFSTNPRRWLISLHVFRFRAALACADRIARPEVVAFTELVPADDPCVDEAIAG